MFGGFSEYCEIDVQFYIDRCQNCFNTATYRQLVRVGKTAEDLLLELRHGGVQAHAALLLRQPHAGRDHLEAHRAGHGDT